MTMKKTIEGIFAESIQVKQQACSLNILQIENAARLLQKTLNAGHKILLCGNGGSAADSQHIAAEFIGRFRRERSALAAIALTTDTSIITALGNDYGYKTIFSRQVEALGKKGDVLIGSSTSGNSENVIEAIIKAKKLGVKTISLTGGNGGKIAKLSDISIVVPSTETARVQESHICIGHILCEIVESQLKGKK